MAPVWKKEGILYRNLFELLKVKKSYLLTGEKDGKKIKHLNDALSQIITSIMDINYSNIDIEDKYLYNAVMYHSEEYNFESNDNLISEIKKLNELFTRLRDLLKSEATGSSESDIKSDNMIKELDIIKNLEEDKILEFARRHIEDADAKVRDFWTTIVQRIRPSRFHTRDVLEKTDEYEIVREIADEHIGKFYRYSLYRNGIAKAYITGYPWPTGSFYISLVVNPYNNNSLLTRMLGKNKSTNADDHNAFYDLIRVYNIMESDVKRMGLKHITTLCILPLMEFAKKRFNYKQTGWKLKGFGTPFYFLVKRLSL